MSIVVTDQGFSDDNFEGDWVTLPSDTPPENLAEHKDVAAITVEFPSYMDGRGFTLGRMLRLAGFTGRLRAKGHVISDQYAMARRSGFDEVEISDDLAARQPEVEWLRRANWQDHDYRARLRSAS